MKKITLLLATVFIAFTGYAQNERAAFSVNDFIVSDTIVYDISTAAQLARLSEQVNAGESNVGDYYRLTADIDLSAYGARFNNGKGWIPIGTALSSFTGHFNGNNHTIKGLYINDAELEFAGLFGVIINGGTVQNLNVEVNITGKNHAGGISGGAGYYSAITNCGVTGSVSGGVSVGGVVGQVSGSITNCYAAVSVAGSDIIGGIAGSVSHNGVVTGCYVAGSVSGNFRVGGVAGQLYLSTVENCAAFNTAITRVSGDYTEFGRIAGYNEEGTLTGNAAREDMIVINEIVSHSDSASLNGVAVNKDIAVRDATIGGRLTQTNGWNVEKVEKLILNR